MGRDRRAVPGELKYVPLWVFQHSENRLGFGAEGQRRLLTF